MDIKFLASAIRYEDKTLHPESFTYCKVECGSGPRCPDKKKIVFVVDLSGSMELEIPALRCSLKAFRDTILNRTPDDKQSEKELDKLFREAVNITLIGFSDEAWVIYSTEKEDKTWDDAVNSIHSHHCTNMGAGIQLAYKNVHTMGVTWIVVMTDGLSNRGEYRTKDSFCQLASKAPPNTRLISLGYGNNFDVNVLSSLGEFTYVSDREMIPVVFGALVDEFVETWGFNAEWDVKDRSKVIIGSPNFGPLYNQRTYGMGYVDYEDQQVTLSFTHISTMSTQSISFVISSLRDDIPDEIKSRYYNSLKAKLLIELYQFLGDASKSRNPTYICKKIKEQVKNWTHPTAVEHREEILQLIEMLDNRKGGDYKDVLNFCASRETDAVKQCSYTVGKEQTPSTKNKIATMLEASSGYE